MTDRDDLKIQKLVAALRAFPGECDCTLGTKAADLIERLARENAELEGVCKVCGEEKTEDIHWCAPSDVKHWKDSCEAAYKYIAELQQRIDELTAPALPEDMEKLRLRFELFFMDIENPYDKQTCIMMLDLLYKQFGAPVLPEDSKWLIDLLRARCNLKHSEKQQIADLIERQYNEIAACRSELEIGYKHARELQQRIEELESSQWIPVSERLPKINGHGVIGLVQIGKAKTIIGSVRLTTDMGDRYKGTANEGEPVWVLWCPHFRQNGLEVIGPNEITHWMPLPAPPEGKR